MSDEVVDFVLAGLEEYLELERELGVRSIEVDRSLIVAPTAASKPMPVAAPKPAPIPAPVKPVIVPKPAPTPERPVAMPKPIPVATSKPTSAGRFDFVFLHDKPLSPKAVEMMSKIIVALGKTAETAPILIEPPIPSARFYVILGRAALAKYQPGVRCAENKWFTSSKGAEMLYLKSPEEIVRFPTVTPAVDAMKKAMWWALKGLKTKVELVKAEEGAS